MNSMGSMYAAVMFLGVQNASSVQPVVDVERTVFYRERAAGMYSALPYAFAQVNHLIILRILWRRWLCLSWKNPSNVDILSLFVVTGDDWDTLHLYSGYDIRSYSLCYDRIWVDGYQVLLVHVRHVLHFVILHILRYDGCVCDSQPPDCCHCFILLLWGMESLLRFYHPTTGKSYCFPLFLYETVFISRWRGTDIVFAGYRGSLYGGDGITGLPPSLGPCTVWLLPSMLISPMIWSRIDHSQSEWRITLTETLDSSMISCPLLQWWLLRSPCSLHSFLPSQ